MSWSVSKRGEAAIKLQAQGEIGDVILGDRHRRAERDGRRPDLFLRLVDAGLQQFDRVGQHLLIKFVADFLDMAGLFVAEQIAGAADVEIMRRELEAGAERIERLQHLQPLLRLRRDRAVGGRREQRIGARLAAPDAPAQLIELRQSKHIGAPDDQRIGVGNVEAGFDDGRREQNVVAAVVEGRHFLFEFGRRHLPMRDDEFRLGHVFAQEGRRLLEIVDARADEKRLAAAITLAQQRFAHDQRVEGRDETAHGEPVDRRRGDQREFAHAGHRELQRARNRRRRQREHMHLGAQLLQALLMADAEMLLLVDDDEAEILEDDALAENGVRADQNIDAALAEFSLGVARLGGADHARQAARFGCGKPSNRCVKFL